jgi:ferric-dicitrate binding protein FerR (iron transport regulator)
MEFFKDKAVCFIILWFLLFPCFAKADNKPVSIDLKGGEAKVALLKGSASVIKAGKKEAQTLAQGNILSNGDQVTTGKNTRIELNILESIAYDNNEKQRDVSVGLILGKTWAKVTRLSGVKGRFAISAKTAIAGVRGTTYRINVYKDNSVMVKVYWGDVVVKSPMMTGAGDQRQKIGQQTKVEAPHAVPGPTPVSMQEWTYLVKALEQIDIKPDGTVSKPFRFSIKDDLNDWVIWNQKRDKEIGDN